MPETGTIPKLFLSPYKQVVNDWNFKTRLSSVELSNLQPFVELYAYFPPNSPITAKMLNEKNRINIEVNSITTTTDANGKRNEEEVTTKGVGYKLARIETQINEHFSRGEENVFSSKAENHFGGVGIQSLSVTRSTGESFNVRYNMQLTIANPFIFENNPEYVSLLTLNSHFILVYGWSNVSQLPNYKYEESDWQSPSEAPQVIDRLLKIDMTPKGVNGFWNAQHVILSKYSVNFDNVGHLKYDLNFITRYNQMLSFFKANDIKQDIIKTIALDTLESTPRSYNLKTSGSDASLFGKGANLDPDTHFIFKKLNYDEKEEIRKEIEETSKRTRTGLVVFDQTAFEARLASAAKEKVYVKLGIAFEVIKDALNSLANGGSNEGQILKFDYQDVSEKLSDTLQQALDVEYKLDANAAGENAVAGQDETILAAKIEARLHKIGNVFDLYVPIPTVLSSLEKIEDNYLSVLHLLKNILDDGVKEIINGVIINMRVDSSSQFQEIAFTGFEKNGISESITNIDKEQQDQIDATNGVLKIEYRTSKGLVENIQMSSATDPNATDTFSLNTLWSSGAGEELITELGKILGNGYQPEKDKSAIANLFGGAQDGEALLLAEEIGSYFAKDETVKTLTKPKSGGEGTLNSLTIRNTLNNWSSKQANNRGRLVSSILLRRDDKGKIVNTNVVMQFLGYYLRRTQLTLHGICNLNTYNFVKLKGLIPTYDNSYYNIIEVTETLQSGKFETIINTHLIRPDTTGLNEAMGEISYNPRPVLSTSVPPPVTPTPTNEFSTPPDYNPIYTESRDGDPDVTTDGITVAILLAEEEERLRSEQELIDNADGTST